VRVTGLDGAATYYELYTPFGQLLASGKTTGDALPLAHPGLLLLKLRVGDRWLVRRVVNLR